MGNINTVTIVLIIANVLVSLKGFNDFTFFEKYKFNVGAIARGEKYRMLSSGFLHINPQHLLFNMITLFFFANGVIYYVGEVRFVIIYFATLITGSLLSYFFHKEDYHYTAVGASGAVMGIIYSAIVFNPWMEINFFIPGFVFGIGYLLYSIYGMKKQIGNIGHDAHFGGAAGGYIITIILAAPLVLSANNVTMTLLLGIPLVVLFVMQKTGRI